MAEYIPPDKSNIPFQFTTGGYQAPDFDRIVGRYVIRNLGDKSIDIELYYDWGIGGETQPSNPVWVGVQSSPGVIGDDKQGIPSFLNFTDYGYGYMDIIYPSNIDSNSDNIPFRFYSIPRLRQVRFDPA